MAKYEILWNDNMECASRGYNSDTIDLYVCEEDSLKDALGMFLSLPEVIGGDYEDIYDYMEDYYEGDVDKVIEESKDLLGFYNRICDVTGGDPYIIWIKENGKTIYKN